MKKSKMHILCPEHIPLENKGEEAIMRGIIDVIFPDVDCEYHIVDINKKNYEYKNGFHIHPGKLFFSDWRTREFELGFSRRQIYSSACSLLRNALNRFFPNWIKQPHKEAIDLKHYLEGSKKTSKYKDSIAVLKEVDYIIAGHNGGLDEYVCHVLNELHSIGYDYGIFGSSMKPSVNKKAILNVFRKTFRNSDFNIARNPIGYRWAIENFPKLIFELNPDPAFGMVAATRSDIDFVMKNNDLASFFHKPVIMFTTAEPAPITRHSFDSYRGVNSKINAHRRFLAEFLKLIHDNFDVNLLMLPHTIGPDKRMDDRLISLDVIKRADLDGSRRVRLLTSDLTAKELKGLIRNAEFLVAERLHSIIGAIGVETPFMSMGSMHDTRINGILIEQMGLKKNVYFLNKPSSASAFTFFKNLYENRKAMKDELSVLNNSIQCELQIVGGEVKNIVGNKIL